MVTTSRVDVTSLCDLGAWIRAYETLANQEFAEIPRGTSNVHILLRKKLNDACEHLASQQKDNLRDSDEYHWYKLAASFGGLVPFGRTAVMHTKARDFAAMAFSHYGLADMAELEALREAFVKAQSTNKDLACKLSLSAGELVLANSLGVDDALAEGATIDASAELVHFKPLVGQIVSMGLGYSMMREKMISILDSASTTAIEVHQLLLIPSVILSTLGEDTEWSLLRSVKQVLAKTLLSSLGAFDSKSAPFELR